MNNIFKKVLFVLALTMSCLAFSVHASASTYKVNAVNVSGREDTLLETDNYDEAKTKMLSYDSTTNSVSVIYKNGVLINAEYALVTFNDATDGKKTVLLYKNASDTNAYTYTSPAYGVEAAFLDYDVATDRVKIMLSGFTGYVDASAVTIVPISELSSPVVTVHATTAINIRECAGLSCAATGKTVNNGFVRKYSEKTTADGYTWYHINNGWFASLNDEWSTESDGIGTLTFYEPYTSGNLIHYYMYFGYNDNAFTNLGTKPDYMTIGTTYYSYDSHYFYTDIVKMLDDYRNDKVGANSINSTNPYYNYYMYLSTRSKTGYTADDFNNIILSYGYTKNKDANVTYVSNGEWTGADRTGISLMYGMGNDFISAQEKYGINAFEAFSSALHESNKGTSMIAFGKNNLFGIGAGDSNAYALAYTYNTPADSLIGFSDLAGLGYADPSDNRYFGAFYGNKESGMNVKYASDPYWGEKSAATYYNNDKNNGSNDLYASTLGITLNKSNIKVYHTPSYSGLVSYTMQNNNFAVDNMAVTVFDKVVNNEGTWYKVYADCSLDENGNKTSATYSFKNSYGYINANDLYVTNYQPTISANDITIKANATFNPLDGVSATDKEDGNLNNTLDVASTNVDTTKVGDYYITYVVYDSAHFYCYKTVNVKVIGNTDPTITQVVTSVSQYTNPDIKSFVVAKDYSGNTLDTTYTGTINFNTLGSYTLTYTTKDSANVTVTTTITVNVIENAKPIINAGDSIIKVDSTFNALEGVSATDTEDGNINVIVTSNNVNTSVIGEYSVTYSATDSVNQTTIKTVKVIVSNKDTKETSFFFNSLKETDGKLELMGYAYFNGIDNTTSSNIKYSLIYRNVDTGVEYYGDVTRLDSGPFAIVSLDGHDYSGSWFKAILDVDSIPDGNYYIYLRIENEEYYNISLIRNRSYQEEVTSFKSIKYVTIKNDYRQNKSNLYLMIRSDELVNKTAGFTYNAFQAFTKMEWSNNNIHIVGNAYSYGQDLGTNTNITRKIIIENQSTFETTSYDIGYTSSGLYDVLLPISDNLGKNKAWYDANIDLSGLSDGTYVIYIITSSNVTDIIELQDRSYRDLEALTKEINGKTYSFKANQEKSSRVELKVKTN